MLLNPCLWVGSPVSGGLFTLVESSGAGQELPLLTQTVIVRLVPITRVLVQGRVDLVPAVEIACQLNSEIEKLRQDRRGAFRWALLGNSVGGFVASVSC